MLARYDQKKSVYGIIKSHQKGSDSSNNQYHHVTGRGVGGEGCSYLDFRTLARKLVVAWLGCDEIYTPSQDGQRLEVSHFIRESGCRRTRPLIRVNVVVVRRVGGGRKACGCWCEELGC